MQETSENAHLWLFGVSPENWEIVRSAHVWAVQTERVRDKLEQGDSLLLYLGGSQPPVFVGVIRIIGAWEKSSAPFWHDERIEGHVKYPWRIAVELNLEGAVPAKALLARLSIYDPKLTWQLYVRGSPANFGRSVPPQDVTLILSEFQKPPVAYEVKTRKTREEPHPMANATAIGEVSLQSTPEHDKIRDMIRWIGEARGLISETEVRINDYRIDCVWRKPVRQLPDQVWEVQIKGNFFEALAKLKHAWDLWGSEPFLVTTDEYAEEARRLLGGTFHEIKSDVRVVHWRDIVKLYNLLIEASTIEKELRI